MSNAVKTDVCTYDFYIDDNSKWPYALIVEQGEPGGPDSPKHRMRLPFVEPAAATVKL